MLLIGGRCVFIEVRLGDWIGVEIGVVSFGEVIVNIPLPPTMEVGVEGLGMSWDDSFSMVESDIKELTLDGGFSSHCCCCC